MVDARSPISLWPLGTTRPRPSASFATATPPWPGAFDNGRHLWRSGHYVAIVAMARFVWHGQNVFNNFVNKMSDEHDTKKIGGLPLEFAAKNGLFYIYFSSVHFSFDIFFLSFLGLVVWPTNRPLNAVKTVRP